jgi:hypothetical protein
MTARTPHELMDAAALSDLIRAKTGAPPRRPDTAESDRAADRERNRWLQLPDNGHPRRHSAPAAAGPAHRDAELDVLRRENRRLRARLRELSQQLGAGET